METSADLVERAVSEYESALVGYARTFVKDIDSARDVVQDTFIRLYHQDVSKVQDGLKAWLYTVCRNRAYDVIRKNKRIVDIDENLVDDQDYQMSSPDQILEQQERLSKMRAMISNLPENQAKVILLKFEEGYSYKEIEEKTGLSSGNIGFLIHTGLKRLKTLIPSDS